MNVADIVDAAIEAPILTSFTKIGPAVRSRVDEWTPLDDYSLDGRTVVITGSTSGLGRHAAERLAGLGATVVVNGRDPERTERARADIAECTSRDDVLAVAGDLGERDDVERMAEELTARVGTVDVLIHNAGALSAERSTNRAGIEATIASQVLGPFLLTARLLPGLRSSSQGRVITVSSGGMYTAPLTVERLQMDPASYGGSEQYARAKRAQVTLNEMWAEREPAVAFQAMHPGWADTPGVRQSLPRFRTVLGPLLRDPEQGADTIVWLAADDRALRSSGSFWLDRRPRPIHKLPTTRRSDTPERRARLWEWCVEQTGAVVDADPANGDDGPDDGADR
jgi:dehydrogenase/reductase SDR family protein 12